MYLLILGALCCAKDLPLHIITILMDDLGYFDTGIHNNTAAEPYSENTTKLARDGVLLAHQPLRCAILDAIYYDHILYNMAVLPAR
jgi:hypothetical protein